MRYIDKTAIVQVISTIYQFPTLLDQTERYTFTEEDFIEPFHRMIFGAIYNLHNLGIEQITSTVIEDYLEEKPELLSLYKVNKGAEYLEKAAAIGQVSSFNYYYGRMKKFTLLRMYNELAGLDLSNLYDMDNIVNVKKKQEQDEWLDNTSIEDIAELIDNKISGIKLKYAGVSGADYCDAGEGMDDLITKLIEEPEVGFPLYGPLFNSIHRGARLGKFYLRSAATGVGKTRSLIGDTCYVGCKKRFSAEQNRWIEKEVAESVLYVTTEQEIDEIQTMMLAFIADVDEDHIINGEYGEGELDRVREAAKIFKESEIKVKVLPDFSLNDIENTIKYAVKQYGCKYVFFDYIHTSMKILSEVTSKTGVKGLREDNILFMISVRLKALCVEYGIFLMSATQLNGDYRTAQQYDQNLLRGAKAIADKIDVGMIMLEVSQDDLEALKPLIEKGYEQPTIKVSIYKNRRGKYCHILIWCRADKGRCKIYPLYATTYQYELQTIEYLNIEVEKRE